MVRRREAICKNEADNLLLQYNGEFVCPKGEGVSLGRGKEHQSLPALLIEKVLQNIAIDGRQAVRLPTKLLLRL